MRQKARKESWTRVVHGQPEASSILILFKNGVRIKILFRVFRYSKILSQAQKQQSLIIRYNIGVLPNRDVSLKMFNLNKLSAMWRRFQPPPLGSRPSTSQQYGPSNVPATRAADAAPFVLSTLNWSIMLYYYLSLQIICDINFFSVHNDVKHKIAP